MKTFDTLPAALQSMIKDVVKMSGIGIYNTVPGEPFIIPAYTDEDGIEHPERSGITNSSEVLDVSVYEAEYAYGLYTFKYNGVDLHIIAKMDKNDEKIISATYNPNI